MLGFEYAKVVRGPRRGTTLGVFVDRSDPHGGATAKTGGRIDSTRQSHLKYSALG